jgi:TolB-like protein
VLEFEVAPGLALDRVVFSDLTRGAVNQRAPHLFVMTRESTVALLEANGKTLADCEGQCEVEVGRKLGADFIISGRLAQVGSTLLLTLRLFSTADGRLLGSGEARGKSSDELLEKFDAALERLVAHLGGAPASQPPPAQAGPKADPNGTMALLDSLLVKKRAPKADASPESHSIYDSLTFRKPATSAFEASSGIELVALAGSVLKSKRFEGRKVESFELARTETTVAAYARCVSAGACAAPATGGLCNWNSGRGDHPINCITWKEAAAFCKWMGGRLPTAPEFELAASSGEDRRFPWGEEEPGARACWAGEGSAVDKASPGTCRVGAFPAGDSKQGLKDLAGNVAEWTGTDHEKPGEKEYRGGSREAELAVLLYARLGLAQDAAKATPWLGFRCAR